MNNAKNIILGFLLLSSIFSCNKKYIKALQSFAPTETYKDDIFLDTTTNKKALIIVAHDDDDCAMSGTIAKLTANGWTVKQLSLVTHIDPETGKNPAHIICIGNEPILEDGLYRIGLDTMKVPYKPIPYADIQKQFYHEKVSTVLIQKIKEFAPSAIFTLDNVKGGYGHPEHIFMSQLVLSLFQEKKIDIQRVYQSVYTRHMEQEIVDGWLKAQMEKWGYPHASTIANQLYGIQGMPEPNTQIKISDFAETKMKYLRSYPENAKSNLRKFIPYYEKFDAETYFNIFDREFFRVFEKE